MQLQDFFDYKNRLMEDILTDETIVKLIQQDTDVEHAGSLMYTQVFPFEYIPETIDGGETYICVDVDLQGSSGAKLYYYPLVYIWVFCHRSNLRLPEGGVRTDKICSEICKKINGSKYYGLGELNLYSVKRFSPQSDYNGKLMTFHATEFGRFFDGTKPIPANRKNP